MEFTVPTPIQAQAIPVIMGNQDLIGCAQTGTGKTAAFSIPMITRLLLCREKTSLILVPTRELAAQVQEVITELTSECRDIRSVLLIGGVAMQPQMRALRARPRIVVATPGRLLDHLERRTVSLAQVEMLVLDEADRMLDMGFQPQLLQILRYLPKSRQTVLFSATMPDDILALASKFLHKPVRVTVGAVSKPIELIQQSMIHTTTARKNEMLLDQINARQGSMLIFGRTQKRVDRLARYLEEYGLNVGRIHGGRSQGQRNAAIASFKDGRTRILVATDIAARGIDISHIAHVINYDLPMVAEDYVHRIGRTGRAGAEGEAISLVTPEERGLWQEITKLLARSNAKPVKMIALPDDKKLSQRGTAASKVHSLPESGRAFIAAIATIPSSDASRRVISPRFQ